jgi:hypothetical protein
VSLNPYASGEAALPATEVVPRAPKVAMTSALLALASVAGLAASIAYVVWLFMHQDEPTDQQTIYIGIGMGASVLLALVGLLFGIGALFIRRHPRTIAAIGTFINGAIVLCTAALVAYVVYQSNPTPT